MKKRAVTGAWISILFLSGTITSSRLIQTRVSVQDSQLTFESSDIGEAEGARIAFESTVGPADFFKRLRRAEAPSGSKYMHDSDEVRFFPDHLVIVIIAVQTSTLSKKKVSHNFMNELHFDGHWKRGMYLRPVKNLALQAKLPSYFSSSLGEGWKYYLDLDDTEVPLDDHLVLDILSADNKRIGRMSFSLREKTK